MLEATLAGILFIGDNKSVADAPYYSINPKWPTSQGGPFPDPIQYGWNGVSIGMHFIEANDCHPHVLACTPIGSEIWAAA